MTSPEGRFWFRLAWQLGKAHPDEILEGLDSRQYTEVMAYGGVEPLDVVRGDFRSALVCLTIAQAAGSRRAKLRHFLLESERKAGRRQTPEEMREAFRRINATMRAERQVSGH